MLKFVACKPPCIHQWDEFWNWSSYWLPKGGWVVSCPSILTFMSTQWILLQLKNPPIILLLWWQAIWCTEDTGKKSTGKWWDAFYSLLCELFQCTVHHASCAEHQFWKFLKKFVAKTVTAIFADFCENPHSIISDANNVLSQPNRSSEVLRSLTHSMSHLITCSVLSFWICCLRFHHLANLTLPVPHFPSFTSASIL